MAYISAAAQRAARQTDTSSPRPSTPACAGAGIGDRGLVADAPASVGPEGASSGLGADPIEAKAPPPTPSSKEEGAPEAPPASAAPTTLPANLPALIEALPGDAARPQQTEFTRDRQVQFLLALADSGAVRRAVKAAGVSHQTAYRMRRATPAFRLAWDAALLAARAVAEDVLATRALDGVEEKVFYHGEEVATRRRYDSRLLLAHLARLDKLVADERVTAFAEDFEEALARFERGEEQPEVEVPRDASRGKGDFSSPGQCNNRSMSNGSAPASAPISPIGRELAEPACDCPGARHGTDGGRPHWRMGPEGPEPVRNTGGRGPCCADPRWPDCRDCPHYPPVDRLLHRMEDARPDDAPPLSSLGDRAEAEACQMEAFAAGDAEWWRYGEGFVPYRPDDHGGWQPVDEEERAAGDAG